VEAFDLSSHRQVALVDSSPWWASGRVDSPQGDARGDEARISCANLMASSGNPARNQALDVLRGLAVVLVLLNHISLDGLDPDGWTCRLLRVAKRGGWMGWICSSF